MGDGMICHLCNKGDHRLHDTSAYKLGCQNVGCECEWNPIRVVGGDYCFRHEWSVLEKGPCPECASDDAHMDAQGRLANDPEEPRNREASAPYFGRDLPALIDVLNAYANGNGANGCNLNTHEARKIAGILTSHVWG